MLLASMKCSSRRNCNWQGRTLNVYNAGLNEVQFPKELQQVKDWVTRPWVIEPQ